MSQSPTLLKILTRLQEIYPKDNWDPANYKLERTRAGRHQRSGGAWAWTLRWISTETPPNVPVGSQWPASVIAACQFDVYQHPWGDISLLPPGEKV